MFQRYFDEGLAQCSFLIACERTGEALVVDPRRDVAVYAEAAARHNLRIAYAIETHIHADFVSGSRELAALGATTIGGPGSNLGFPYREARHGDLLEAGDLRCRFLHTPGHTPEHISILVEQPDEPVRVFTGDTLFVGAVGRPDLLGEDLTRQLAGQLYDSLCQTLMSLDDAIEVHPGHGAGSLCGAGIGKEPCSTIGQERRFNPMLRQTSKESFVAAVLADLPETPSYFPRMKRVNHDGPAVLGLTRGYPDLAALTPAQAAAAARDGAWIVDLRSVGEFGAGHAAGAINIPFGSKVGYWAGWIVPGDARVVLLAASDTHVASAQPQLLRVGLDRIDGFVAGGFGAWERAGLPVESLPAIEIAELRARLARREPITLLDVRTRKEFAADHIEGAINVPVGDLPSANLPSATGPVLTLCEAGVRSSVAASILQRRGVRDVVNVTGGMNVYRELAE
jgi:hydroxyacylglutathione hydrolase